jgi:ABC-type dipeptide/oligopeptide/nickel transport system ATPase subunit
MLPDKFITSRSNEISTYSKIEGIDPFYLQAKLDEAIDAEPDNLVRKTKNLLINPTDLFYKGFDFCRRLDPEGKVFRYSIWESPENDKRDVKSQIRDYLNETLGAIPLSVEKTMLLEISLSKSQRFSQLRDGISHDIDEREKNIEEAMNLIPQLYGSFLLLNAYQIAAFTKPEYLYALAPIGIALTEFYIKRTAELGTCMNIALRQTHATSALTQKWLNTVPIIQNKPSLHETIRQMEQQQLAGWNYVMDEISSLSLPGGAVLGGTIAAAGADKGISLAITTGAYFLTRLTTNFSSKSSENVSRKFGDEHTKVTQLSRKASVDVTDYESIEEGRQIGVSLADFLYGSNVGGRRLALYPQLGIPAAISALTWLATQNLGLVYYGFKLSQTESDRNLRVVRADSTRKIAKEILNEPLNAINEGIDYRRSIMSSHNQNEGSALITGDENSFLIRGFIDAKGKIRNDFEWELKPGINFLIGLSGEGKSSLIRYLMEYLRENNIPHTYAFPTRRHSEVPIGLEVSQMLCKGEAGRLEEYLINRLNNSSQCQLFFTPEELINPRDSGLWWEWKSLFTSQNNTEDPRLSLISDCVRDFFREELQIDATDILTNKASAGQLERAELVCATLNPNNRVLICDDIVSLNDPGNKQKMISYCNKQLENGQIVLFITHNYELIQTWATLVPESTHQEVAVLTSDKLYKEPLGVWLAKEEIVFEQSYDVSTILSFCSGFKAKAIRIPYTSEDDVTIREEIFKYTKDLYDYLDELTKFDNLSSDAINILLNSASQFTEHLRQLKLTDYERYYLSILISDFNVVKYNSKNYSYLRDSLHSIHEYGLRGSYILMINDPGDDGVLDNVFRRDLNIYIEDSIELKTLRLNKSKAVAFRDLIARSIYNGDFNRLLQDLSNSMSIDLDDIGAWGQEALLDAVKLASEAIYKVELDRVNGYPWLATPELLRDLVSRFEKAWNNPEFREKAEAIIGKSISEDVIDL